MFCVATGLNNGFVCFFGMSVRVLGILYSGTLVSLSVSLQLVGFNSAYEFAAVCKVYCSNCARFV
jgi:hypothetical protein